MVKKKGRFIYKKTVRGMYSWRHYIFMQRPLAKAELVPACTVIECDEPYTSKTCGACGFIHKNLGRRKVFALPKVRVPGEPRCIRREKHHTPLPDHP